jgi:nucleoside-diphosphate-sugar epimerase
MNVMITGATGFIGSHLLQLLLKENYQINALVRCPDKIPLHPNIKTFKGDISNLDSIISASKNCEAIFHCAALAKSWVKDNEEYFQTNVTGTKNVLEAALHNNVSKVIYTSSCGVIGPSFQTPMKESDPRIIGFQLDYEKSKYLAEQVCKDYIKKGLNIVIVNPSKVFGTVNDTQNGLDQIIQSHISGKWPFLPNDGGKIANFAFIKDVCNGHLLALKNGKSGERYILGGKNLTYQQVFQILHSIIGKKFFLLPIPLSLIKAIGYLQLLFYYLTGKAPLINPKWVNRMNFNSAVSSEKAIKELGYSITAFEAALKESLTSRNLLQ